MKCVFLVIAYFNVILFSDFNKSFAQSKIKDGSVAGSAVKALPGVLLELESNKQGFLLPRFTTQQRNAIVQSKLKKGLIIFNTTTECIDYWSVEQGRWLSLCGQLVATIDTLQCSKVLVNGVYKRGKALTNDNYLSVVVTVSQFGNYVINAATTNGYTFSGTGSFAANGAYTVNLDGSGSPLASTPGGGAGDEVYITVNGINSNCKPHVKVAPADVAFEMACNASAVNGSYMIGMPLSAANTLTLPVNVIEPGAYAIKSNTTNGYYFTGSDTFTTTGDQTVILKGTGTPAAAGTNTFTLTSNSAVSNTCGGLMVTIPAVAFTMNCKEAIIKGTYMQDAALTTDNTLTLPVTVSVTGPYRITTDNQNGMTFAASGVFKDTGLHQVVLTGTGTPFAPGTSQFTVTGNDTIKCSAVSVSVNAQPIAYTLESSSIAVKGKYMAGVPLTAENTITLTANAKYGGNYAITTNTVDGISFIGSGTLKVGSNSIVLTSSGKPVKGGDYTFTISTNSSKGSDSYPVSIPVQLRTIRVLGLGSGFLNIYMNPTVWAVLTSKANFGPDGKVIVDSISLIRYSDGYTASQLQNLISSSGIDIIVYGTNGYPDGYPNAADRAVLIDFVKNKKGVLLNFNNGSPYNNWKQVTSDLANDLYGISSISGSWGDQVNQPWYDEGSGVVYKFADSNDPLLKGPFGDLRGGYWGRGQNGSTAFLNGLPSDAIIYSKGNAVTGSTGVSSFRHATLGYLWVGTTGFSYGKYGYNQPYQYPALMDANNNPVPKDNYGRSEYGGPVTVYNSVFYANAMAWAIKYVLENRP